MSIISMRDVFFTILEMFSIALTIMLCFILVSSFNDSPKIAGDAQASAMVTATQDAFITYYDIGFLIMFVSAFSGMLILGRMLPTHPIFLIPFCFILLFLVIFTGIVSNWWDAFSTSPQISAYAALFTYIPFVMANLPIMAFIMSIVLAAVVYTGTTSTK